MIANRHLATYLNNHRAASVTVLNLLSHLETVYTGTDIAAFLATLRSEITADRDELDRLMAQLQIDHNTFRQTIAWFGEKANQLQLRLDDSADGPLHLLEALEVVAVGIEGKRALANSLLVVAREWPELQPADYERLAQRSKDQSQQVEEVRLAAVRAAFLTKPA